MEGFRISTWEPRVTRRKMWRIWASEKRTETSTKGVGVAESRHVRTRTKSASKGRPQILVAVGAWSGVWYLEHCFLPDDERDAVGAVAGYQPKPFFALLLSVWLVLQGVSSFSPPFPNRYHLGSLESRNPRRLIPLDLSPPFRVWTPQWGYLW